MRFVRLIVELVVPLPPPRGSVTVKLAVPVGRGADALTDAGEVTTAAVTLTPVELPLLKATGSTVEFVVPPRAGVVTFVTLVLVELAESCLLAQAEGASARLINVSGASGGAFFVDLRNDHRTMSKTQIWWVGRGERAHCTCAQEDGAETKRRRGKLHLVKKGCLEIKEGIDPKKQSELPGSKKEKEGRKRWKFSRGMNSSCCLLLILALCIARMSTPSLALCD